MLLSNITRNSSALYFFLLENGDCIVVDKGMNTFQVVYSEEATQNEEQFYSVCLFLCFLLGRSLRRGHLSEDVSIDVLHCVSAPSFHIYVYVRLSALMEIFSCGVLTDGIEHKAMCEENRARKGDLHWGKSCRVERNEFLHLVGIVLPTGCHLGGKSV